MTHDLQTGAIEQAFNEIAIRMNEGQIPFDGELIDLVVAAEAEHDALLAKLRELEAEKTGALVERSIIFAALVKKYAHGDAALSPLDLAHYEGLLVREPTPDGGCRFWIGTNPSFDAAPPTGSAGGETQ